MPKNSININCLDSKNNSRKNLATTAPVTQDKIAKPKKKNMKLAD